MSFLIYFTSCKDYDDDIKDLQGQINSNKDAIAALQKLVGEGKWVTSVSPIENGFIVTMNDGSSQNITGIDGEDGKPGTVISLDPTTNNWIIDGVDSGVCAKGENGADGEDGKPGEAGEPGKSPYIDAETGNWFVYQWDEATGEYKAVDSGVYAGAAKVYVVEKEGFIELNVDGTAYLLPTTSDAYTVDAPYSKVVIRPETGKWNPTTTNKNYQALLKAFPEIGKIEKDSLLKQGAELPVLVTPASIDLTDGFKFSLQTLKDGMVEDITLSNPTKGISNEWYIVQNQWISTPVTDNTGNVIGETWVPSGEDYMTRAANQEDCYWTLQVGQLLENNKYATADNVALVVENANGKVVKTPFVYTIDDARQVGDVFVYGGGDNPELADEIDLLAPAIMADGTKGQAPIILVNDFAGKYIITLADQLQVEKYGLSIVDGHKLVISKPGNDTKIDVKLNVVALGLNGSVYNTANIGDITITVTQTMDAVGQLSEKNFTLSVKKAENGDAKAGQFIKWDIEELGFTTATQLQNFIDAEKKITLIDEDGKEVKEYPFYNPLTSSWEQPVEVVKADGSTTTTYANADALQFKMYSGDVVPGNYRVVVEALDGTTSIFKTETTMEINNPKAEDLFALATAYTKEGILQVVGDPFDPAVTTDNVDYNFIRYMIPDGVVEKVDLANANVVKIEDLDHTEWAESDGSQSWGAANWIVNEITGEINIPDEGREFVGTDAKREGKNHLNKERKIRITYNLFGNTDNEIEYEFKVKILSAVYDADAENIEVDKSKLNAKFDGKDFNLKQAISATYAAGINVGKKMELFDVTTDASTKMVNVYTATGYDKSGEYVLDTTGKPIEIAKDDLMAFGMTAADYVAVKDPIYLMQSNVTTSPAYKGWSTIMIELLAVYEDNGDGGLKVKDVYKENQTMIASVATQKALFDKYGAMIKWNQTEVNVPAETKYKADEVKKVTFAFADNDALKYCDVISDAEAGVIKTKTNISDSDLVNGEAKVNINMTVEDVWGLKMVKPIQVIIKK